MVNCDHESGVPDRPMAAQTTPTECSHTFPTTPAMTESYADNWEVTVLPMLKHSAGSGEGDALGVESGVIGSSLNSIKESDREDAKTLLNLFGQFFAKSV